MNSNESRVTPANQKETMKSEILKSLEKLMVSLTKANNALNESKLGSVARELHGSLTTIRKMIEKTEYEPMDVIKESIKGVGFTEFAVWLDLEYNYNHLINQLDEPKRQQEILDQLINDLD